MTHQVITQAELGAQRPAMSGAQVVTAYDAGIAAPVQTQWTRFANTQIAVQLDGTATSVIALVLRSAINPFQNPGALGAPADTGGFNGDVATGVAPLLYVEPGIGWWCVNLTTVSGGSVNVSMAGIGGDKS